MNEVRILRTVKHPCIINLEDVIDTPDFLFIGRSRRLEGVEGVVVRISI